MINKTSKDCCEKTEGNGSSRGFWQGIIFGILPHTFCILFVISSIIGATGGSLFLQKFIIIPYLFQVLVAVSFVFATLSAVIYLRRADLLSFSGMKQKWKYLVTMYSITIAINLLLFYVIIPFAGGVGTANFRAADHQLVQNQVLAKVQTIEMDQTGAGYVPRNFTVKVNQPVRWLIHSKSRSCAASINAPEFGISQELVNGDNIVEFTPKTTGSFAFSCFMGMYRGNILVVE